MQTMSAQVSLAPFTHDWVGGDIGGLAQLAGTLYGYAPEVTGVAAALDAQVRQVVGAAGWQGKAALAFTAAWERDSRTAQAFGVATDLVAGIVGWLATALSQIEAGLEQAAEVASAHGVPIGADGAAPQVCYAGTGGPGAAAAQQWLSEYQGFYAACLRAAQAARQEAAASLLTMARQIVDGAGKHVGTAESINTVGDLLYDLLSSLKGEKLAEQIEKLWQGSGAHTPVSKKDPVRDDPDDPDEPDGSIGIIDDLSATIGALLGTYDDVHNHHMPLLNSLIVETFGAEAGARLPQLPKFISFLADSQAAGGEAGAEAGEVVADGEVTLGGADPLVLAGVALNDDIHNAFLEPWPTDVREHGVVTGLFDGYENAFELETFAELKGNVTDAVRLNSKVSLADVAVEHAQEIGQAAGDEVDRIERAWDDPGTAFPGGLP